MSTSPTSENLPEFLTTSQFAQRTQLSVATVKRLCDGGELAHVVVSERGDRRIPTSEVGRLLEEAHANRIGQ